MEQIVDPDRICEALLSSISGDAGHRREAEAYLKSISLAPRLISTLLEILNQEQISKDVRSAAAVMLKNEIRSNWNCTDGKLCNEDDRIFLKNNIYKVLTSITQHDVRSQVIESIRIIAFHDFPEKWPGLLSSICIDLEQRENANKLYCALMCLRKLCGKYEYKDGSNRDDLDSMISLTFHLLLKIASDLCSVDISNDEPASLLKLICKIYWSSTQMNLSKSQCIIDSLDEWMLLMEFLIKAPAGTDNFDRQIFKAKKWAIQIVHRFFIRYCDKAISDTTRKKDTDFGEAFLSVWAQKFTEIFLDLIKDYSFGNLILSDRLVSLIIQFLTQGIEIASIYKKHIKPNGNLLLFNVCFRLLHYTSTEEILWKDDPIEFHRRQINSVESFSHPNEAAIDFVSAIGRLRSVDFLLSICKFMENIFQNYEKNKINNIQTNEWDLQKYGALYMFGCVAQRLTNKKRNVPVESILEKYVINELTSPNKFIRLRSCWVLEKYMSSAVEWKNVNNLLNAFKYMLRCLNDAELPVCLKAGKSIRIFFDIQDETLQNTIKDEIPGLMQRLLVLMEIAGDEFIVSTLNNLTSHYEQHICVYAKVLIMSLSSSLITILSQGDEISNENEDTLLVASSIIQTMRSVLDSICDNQQMFIEVVDPLCSVLDVLFLPDNIDQMEDALEILTYLTFHLPEIPQRLWKYFDWMYVAICGGENDILCLPEMLRDGYAPDLLEHMIPPLDNFITRDFETFAIRRNSRGISSKQMIVEMANKVVSQELEPKYGLELLCILFESCWETQGADEYIEPVLRILFTWLGSNTDYERQFNSSEKRKILKLLSILIFYSFYKLKDIAEKLGCMNDIFNCIFSNTKFMKRPQDKRFLLLGLSRVVANNEGSILDKEIIFRAISVMFEEFCSLVELLGRPEHNSDRILKENDNRSDESVNETDSEQELQDYQDAIKPNYQNIVNADNGLSWKDKANCQLEMINEVNVRDYVTSYKPEIISGEDSFSDDDDDDDSSYVTNEETEERISPLDKINELQLVREAFISLPDNLRTDIDKYIDKTESMKFKNALETATTYIRNPI